VESINARTAIALDVYGTLVDPLVDSGPSESLVRDKAALGRTVAGQLEYSFPSKADAH
jgi:hypothetical protein